MPPVKLAASIIIALAVIGAGVGAATGGNAADALTDRARSGDPGAERELGEAYLFGRGVPVDPVQGLSWLELAAADNDAHAHYLLARHLTDQKSQTYDTQRKIVEHLSTAASLGHTTAQARLGEMLLAKARDVSLPQAERNRVRENGLAFLTHAAAAKNGYAAYRLGALQWAGTEITRDEGAAIANFEIAAANAQPAAYWWLAQRYLDAESGFANQDAGMQHLERAAQAGISQAMVQLASRYQSGEGVLKDLRKARQWADAAVAKNANGARTVLSSVTQAIAEQEGQAEATRAAQLAAALPKPSSIDEPRLIQVANRAPGPAAAHAVVPPPRASRTQDAQLNALVADARVTSPTTPPSSVAGGLAWSDAPIANDGGYDLLKQRVGSLERRLQSLELTVEKQRAELEQKDGLIAQLTGERDAAIARRDQAEGLLRQIASNVRDFSRGAAQPAAAPTTPSPAVAPRVAATGVSAEQVYRAGLDAMRAQRFEDAIDQFTKAGAQGHAGALNNLGMLYLQGQGARADVKRAIGYFEQAARLGLGSAANNLGFIYQTGHDTAPNRTLAARWYRDAVALGYVGARRALDELEPASVARIAAK